MSDGWIYLKGDYGDNIGEDKTGGHFFLPDKRVYQSMGLPGLAILNRAIA